MTSRASSSIPSIRSALTLFCLAFALIGATFHARADSQAYDPVTVLKRVEPTYPAWAYQNGIGHGYAKIAFYVDEDGQASEFLPIEYTHSAFAEKLVKAVQNWKLQPAHRHGRPIKSICRAYWDFRPDRPITMNTFTHFDNRFSGKSAETYRELECETEQNLDSSLTMLRFPPVVAPPDYDIRQLAENKIMVKCCFYVDSQGLVCLPLVVESTAPDLNPQVLQSLRATRFTMPTRDNRPVLTYAEKTYLLHVAPSDELASVDTPR